MNPLEDVLVRILVAELLPGGVGACKKCNEPIVIGVEELLIHYAGNHPEVVTVGLLVAMLGVGFGVFAVRSVRS